MTDIEEKTSSKENVSDSSIPPKAYWFWMKNSKGEASASLTFTSVAFIVTTIAFILSMFESLGPVALRQFDVAATSVYLIPLLSLYFGRRFIEARYPGKTNGLK